MCVAPWRTRWKSIEVDGKHVSQLCRCYGCGSEVTSNFCFACEFPDKLGPELRHYGENHVAEAADQSNPISGTEGVKSNFNCLGSNHSNPSCGNVGVAGQESFGGDQSKSARSKEGIAADEFVSMHVFCAVVVYDLYRSNDTLRRTGMQADRKASMLF